jgi:hypothetical protein
MMEEAIEHIGWCFLQKQMIKYINSLKIIKSKNILNKKYINIKIY